MSENRIILVLFAGVVISLVAVFGAEKLFPNDGQMFQVVAGLLSGFAGALFTRINPRRTQDQLPAPNQPPANPPA